MSLKDEGEIGYTSSMCSHRYPIRKRGFKGDTKDEESLQWRVSIGEAEDT